MSVFRPILALAFVCLASLSAAQFSDQLAAERVLGPHWRQISRSSGMIFSGTVLQIDAQPVGKGSPLPLVLTKFRVDRDIDGVHRGETLTVREWAGAWSMQRPMTPGQRLLILLYPPSRLGLTSPVGGRLGQVALDPRGEIVSKNLWEFPSRQVRAPAAEVAHSAPCTARLKLRPFKAGPNPDSFSQATDDCGSQNPALRPRRIDAPQSVTLAQLERAIRDARRKSVRNHKE